MVSGGRVPLPVFVGRFLAAGDNLLIGPTGDTTCSTEGMVGAAVEVSERVCLVRVPASKQEVIFFFHINHVVLQ